MVPKNEMVSYPILFYHSVYGFLQVVWRAMQEEFIQQYKYIEELIQRCYPGSMIVLDFSIQNILEFFSEIALSH